MRLNPNGVVARRTEDRLHSLPAGLNPVGVKGPSITVTQGCPYGPTLDFVTQPRCG